MKSLTACQVKHTIMRVRTSQQPPSWIWDNVTHSLWNQVNKTKMGINIIRTQKWSSMKSLTTYKSNRAMMEVRAVRRYYPAGPGMKLLTFYPVNGIRMGVRRYPSWPGMKLLTRFRSTQPRWEQGQLKVSHQYLACHCSLASSQQDQSGCEDSSQKTPN